MAHENQRLYLLDAARAALMISMVLYHAMYDLVVIFGQNAPWFFDTPGFIWQQSICWGFIFLSGFCHRLSKSPLKHGVLVSACGLLITLVTAIFMPSELIIMGVLSFLGLASIITALLDKPFSRLPQGACLAASAALFFVLRNINERTLGFGGITLLTLPESLYGWPGGFILGFFGRSFYSSDYFSLLPWIFLFWCGYFLFGLIGKENLLHSKALAARLPFLSALGKHSLLIYLLHQPLLTAVFFLVFNVF